jgi:hypothetical protein
MAMVDRPRILIISGDHMDQKIDGMGIRYWEMARALSSYCRVTLVVHSETDLVDPDFHLQVFRL